ncbi:MAG: hypothetical protein JXJ04_18095 [Spirochaetales bacterium]|nr:hypothetical protein [Spirochaetales bacterium]
MQSISLADIPDQRFRYPGEFVSVLTSIRMNPDAGERTKLAISIDPENEIDELNEYQNTYSRTICPPAALNGPDFIISSAALSGDSMIMTIKNRGPQVSIPGIHARIHLYADGNPVMTQPIILPSILPRNMSAVSIRLTQSSGFNNYSRITAAIETINILDEIDNTDNSFDYGELLPATMLQYHSLLSVPKIANNIDSHKVSWEG